MRPRYENPLRERFDDTFFKDLPQAAGVYCFLDESGSPLYIGKANCLRKRLLSYRRAKPGSVPDHTLEMLERAVRLEWEIHESGEKALAREADLLRAIRPPFNIQGTFPIEYLHLGLRCEAIPRGKHAGLVRAEFRLSHGIFDEGFRTFGCFKFRRHARAGYGALLRLFFAATQAGSFHFPARLSDPYPPYLYSARLLPEWTKPLDRFLAGTSPSLLNLLATRLLEMPNVPRFLYGRVEKDLRSAKTFYETGPRATRVIARELGLSGSYVPQEELDGFVQRQLARRIASQGIPSFLAG